MGLTGASSGRKALKDAKKDEICDYRAVLAGNPNVGKSTVFNGLTGMNQHTGNWPGKTVAVATGTAHSRAHSFLLVDVPGTYSLLAHSPEEEVARNFICFEKNDAIAVVCDGTCLERNLNLVLQIIESGENVLVLVNLMDEAKRKGIHIDTSHLSAILGVPVIGITARSKKSLFSVDEALDKACKNPVSAISPIKYSDEIEKAVDKISAALPPIFTESVRARFHSLRLLEGDTDFILDAEKNLGVSFNTAVCAAKEAREQLFSLYADENELKDAIVTSIVGTAERIANEVVKTDGEYNGRDRKIDRILTGRRFGYPIMLLLLAVVLWLTIYGANYPSDLLSAFFSYGEKLLEKLFFVCHIPYVITDALVHGVYRVLSWVISVMLPPMAIFFPFFTLLEDSGYLPRIAYNLDKPFKCSGACGKQALTMCMGFGCNAAGVVGCRIIDSPRERILAILTNSFVPCNGRFPMIIALITMFLISGNGIFSSFLSAIILTAVIVIGVLATFGATKLLSLTVFRGKPSSFTLEMPPYRRPQIGKVIVRSIFDRTLFVLGRSVAFAAPAGLVIWLLANITFGEASILSHAASFLDPFARLMGLDGAILIAFLLGLPANEIVIPIMVMTYVSGSTLSSISSLEEIKALLILNGWTVKTAISMILFSLFHWPCATTLMTIKKETGSIKYTFIALLLPTVIGITVCILFNLLFSVLSF